MKTPLEQLADSQALSKSRERPTVGGTHATVDVLADDLDPRLVIRGESFNTPHNIQEESHPYSAHTDWLNFTFVLPNCPDAINQFRHDLSNALGKEFVEMTDMDKGWLGFKRSFTIGNTGAKFAIGSQQGRALVSLSGTSCQYISKEGWENLVDLMTKYYEGKITRWDGAVDDIEGEHSIDWAVNQYRNGGFSTGGNKPFSLQHGDWEFRNGNGRTLTFGKRQNGKYLRVYEKGKQLGDPASLWVRWELQLGQAGRIIPWNVLLVPGQYVAGAYECTKWITSEIKRIKTFQKKKEATLEHLKYWCGKSYGGMLNELLKNHSPEEILDELINEGIPKRLDFPEPID